MKKRKIISAAISVFITASVLPLPCHAYSTDELTGIYGDILDSAETVISDTSGINSANDWLAYSLAKAGRKNDAYLNALEEYVSHEYAENGGLNLTTDYCRVSLVINALGGSPDKIAHNGDDYINLLSDGIFNAEDFGKQGLNAYIWALITLGECAYDAPEKDTATENLINHILDSELKNGGFAVQGNNPNPDVTAQAARALSPYAEERNDVGETVKRCKELLISMKNSDGTYSSFGVPNTETTAQAVIAFAALNDEEQLKNAVSAMMTFYVKNDIGTGFLHSAADENTNITATAQGLEALTLYLKSEGVVFEQEEENVLDGIFSGMGAYINIALIMVFIFVLLVVMDRIARRNKKEHKED